MSLYFLICAGVLVAFAIPLLLYILATETNWNFHKVWDAAIGGHKPSRWYLGLVLSAFALAVIGFMFAVGEQRERKAAASKSHAKVAPNQSLEPTRVGKPPLAAHLQR